MQQPAVVGSVGPLLKNERETSGRRAKDEMVYLSAMRDSSRRRTCRERGAPDQRTPKATAMLYRPRRTRRPASCMFVRSTARRGPVRSVTSIWQPAAVSGEPRGRGSHGTGPHDGSLFGGQRGRHMHIERHDHDPYLLLRWELDLVQPVWRPWVPVGTTKRTAPGGVPLRVGGSSG